MLATFTVWTICSARYQIEKSKSAANAVVGMIYIYYFWYNIAWSGMLVGYTVEILPYNIRAKGLTVMFLMVDIVSWISCSAMPCHFDQVEILTHRYQALFFNQYVNPIALDGKNILR